MAELWEEMSRSMLHADWPERTDRLAGVVCSRMFTGGDLRGDFVTLILEKGLSGQ